MDFYEDKDAEEIALYNSSRLTYDEAFTDAYRMTDEEA
jgi:hypothetical protein